MFLLVAYSLHKSALVAGSVSKDVHSNSKWKIKKIFKKQLILIIRSSVAAAVCRVYYFILIYFYNFYRLAHLMYE